MKKTSLAGIWSLTGTPDNSKKNITCHAEIPGDFHSALLKESLITDPYYAKNEADELWIGKTDWTIERNFDFKNEAGHKTYIVMTFVDTCFTVSINEKIVGNGNNMFCKYRFDITDFLKEGQNTISIHFISAEKFAAEESKKIGYPIPTMEYPIQSSHRNLVRKVQCHAGWDWGPCLLVSGIYGTIDLETTETGWFNSLTVRYTKNKEQKNIIWTVKATLNYEAINSVNRNFIFQLTGNDCMLPEKKVSFNLIPGKNKIECDFQIQNPVLWKSADELKEENLSENNLYQLSASIENSKSVKDDEIKQNIAFRTLKLITKPDITEGISGKTMYFELNGRPLFAKGANWVPVDAIPSRQTKKRYCQLLQDMVNANMNMVRLWGGGQFEFDIFYDLCDKLGIMIWHDCMFACSMYPATDSFLQNVKDEMDYQIPRLQSHPSIALWCGNNENLGALKWFKETNENRDLYLIDYDRLNHGILEQAVLKHDPDRQWWPSSPCAGKDNYADNWHSDAMGDMHYWSVWHEKKSFDAYLSIKPRFVSEFGYESFPSMDCIKSYSPKNQFNLTSPVMEYHQRSVGGNSIILENFSRYFRFPEGFENSVYLSQIQQALAIQTAVDYWRSLKPHCMGALIWQLNDVWPVASWSSIEYSGKWKLLHYQAKKFFAPVSISLFKKNNTLFAFTNNDTRQNLLIEGTIRIIDFDGNDVGSAIQIRTDCSADSVTEIWRSKIANLPCSPENCFIYAVINCSTEHKNFYKAESTCFPELFKNCEIKKPELTYSVSKVLNVKGEDSFNITIKTKAPAFFVSLDCGGLRGIFDTNMITILPERPAQIVFTPENKIRRDEFEKELTIRTLRDTY